MKRVVALVVTFLMIIVIASAEVIRTDDSTLFAQAISMLKQMDSRESVEDAKSMFGQITSKYNQSNLFAIYADTILDIYDENYELAQTKTDVLSMNETFVKLLIEYELQGCDVLQQYIAGRRLEESGNYSEALAVYATMNFYDSPERMITIMDKAKEQSYNYAQTLFASGTYDQAAEVFSSLGSYKDSAEMAEKAKTLIPTPTPATTDEPMQIPTNVIPEYTQEPANSEYDLSNYISATVHVPDGKYLVMQDAPFGEFLPNIAKYKGVDGLRYKNGDTILIHKSIRESGFLFAYSIKADAYAYVNEKYVSW